MVYYCFNGANTEDDIEKHKTCEHIFKNKFNAILCRKKTRNSPYEKKSVSFLFQLFIFFLKNG